MFPYGETVTILSGVPVQDEYGNDVVDWETADRVEVSGVAVAPRPSTEESGRQSTVIVGLSLYMPPDTVIGPQDRVEVRGDLWEVEGEPGEWVNPFSGWEPGIEVAVRRVTG